MNYPIDDIRSCFPILSRRINRHPLVYLDSATSAQKPSSVIECEANFYRKEYSAVHRGVYTLSNRATESVEDTRQEIANFIHAKSREEIVFVKSTTEGINLIANSLAKCFIAPHDNVIVSEMEHHSNIVPWQILAKELNVNVRTIPLLKNGTLDYSRLSSFLNEKTRLISLTHVSNVLGTTNPIEKIVRRVRNFRNVLVLVDGAQSVMHRSIDVQKMDCDFYVFSGHKMYGPSGVGVVYGKKKILDRMPPWEVGGGMVRTVTLEKSTFLPAPWKFEAGSLNVPGILGLRQAIVFIEQIGFDNIRRYESMVMNYALDRLTSIPGLVVYGASRKTSVVSFNLESLHPYDIASFLDHYGIAIRTGHHCAMPTMAYFGVQSMCRVSLALYTSLEEIEVFVKRLVRVVKTLKILKKTHP